MIAKPAYYVGVSAGSFRPDEPAEIVGVKVCRQHGEQIAANLCYVVRYADGFEDYCPVDDRNAYKVIEASEVRKKLTRD